ncbi:MAG: hypothetical protein ABI446_12835 [Gemmatimonadaceae bacterium]
MPVPLRRIDAITTGLCAIGAVVGGVVGIGAMAFLGLTPLAYRLPP